MPFLTEDSLPPFPEGLPLADIYSVDYDKLKDGNQEEARKVFEASRGYGFFYLTNTHIDYNFMFDLAEDTFNLDIDTKMKYEMGNTGSYYGYKMSGSNYVDEKGTPDQYEMYNVSKDDVMKIGQYKENPLSHPDTVHQRRAELERFMESSHQVSLVILRALAEQLGLDPKVLLDIHKLEQPSGDQARVTFAPPVSEDTICFGEHTDFGSVTILFNQLGGLQIINPDSYEWKYVKPYPGTAIINLGDAIVKLVGDRLRSAVHRVMGPPGAQAQSPRHSVVYFARPISDTKLASLLPSDNEDPADAMTIDEWLANRVRLRRTANYKDEDTFNASRGTEHTKERGKVTHTTATVVDKAAKVVDHGG